MFYSCSDWTGTMYYYLFCYVYVILLFGDLSFCASEVSSGDDGNSLSISPLEEDQAGDSLHAWFAGLVWFVLYILVEVVSLLDVLVWWHGSPYHCLRCFMPIIGLELVCTSLETASSIICLLLLIESILCLHCMQNDVVGQIIQYM